MRTRRPLGAAIALCLTLAACGGGSGDTGTSSPDAATNNGVATTPGSATGGSGGGTSSASAAPQEQSDGILQDVLSQDVDTLLPSDSNVGDNIAVLDVVYDGLVRYDAAGNRVKADWTTGATTSWAIRSPRRIVKSSSPRLIRMTFTSPR